MKSVLPPPSPRPLRNVLEFLAGTLLTLTSLLAEPAGVTLDVGVRTQLDRQKIIWDGIHSHRLENAPEHGKIYAILMIQPTLSIERLVKPVKAAGIRDELVRQLETNGYHQVQPNQKPDIILTVTYGRSWLPNPYYTHDTDVDNMGPELPPPPGAGIVVWDPAIRVRLMETGIEAKATKSLCEKLFILVRALKYPPPLDPKKKPEVLWVTTMYVDDPDNRDLNVIYKQMLEAGAPYFDREIKSEEIDIFKPLPEGHVNVGTPEVVETTEQTAK